MDKYVLNVAQVSDQAAWDSTPAAPKFIVRHYCKIDLGTGSDHALKAAADIAGRFPQGDKPGQFVLNLTVWQERGRSVPINAPQEEPAT